MQSPSWRTSDLRRHLVRCLGCIPVRDTPSGGRSNTSLPLGTPKLFILPIGSWLPIRLRHMIDNLVYTMFRYI